MLYDPPDRVDDVKESHHVMSHLLELVVAEGNVNDGPAVVVGELPYAVIPRSISRASPRRVASASSAANSR
jgi:hypothetical protein